VTALMTVLCQQNFFFKIFFKSIIIILIKHFCIKDILFTEIKSIFTFWLNLSSVSCSLISLTEFFRFYLFFISFKSAVLCHSLLSVISQISSLYLDCFVTASLKWCFHISHCFKRQQMQDCLLTELNCSNISS